ncbi:non-canonical purine NTP diphosphatase [Urechidicola sp. KH5]
MDRIVFATNNANKLAEVQQMLPQFTIVGLKDIGCTEDIAETATTLEGNAAIKANFVFQNFGLPCFADDTGLEVDALNGEPGVYSARYAGEPANAENNMQKLLAALINTEDRTARFRTVIAYKTSKDLLYFEGACDGVILHEKHGEKGFGYDPIFKPNGFDSSFAEMTMDEKSKISHRGRAVQKFISYLKS